MKVKSLLLTMLLAFAAPWAAMAQNTITLTGNVTQTIEPNTTYNFYDSGGPNDNYSTSQNYTATLTSTGVITINFSQFVTESANNCNDWDHMHIYDGTASNGTLLARGQTGCSSATLTTGVDYAASSGTMTIVWKSDGSQVAAGWAATITAQNPTTYTINSASDWSTFKTNVENGTIKPYDIVKLNANISVTTMVGTDSNPFRGTFDGQGHTLTVNIDGGNNQGAAPFRYISGATIENLKVKGTVTSTNHHAGGLVGFADNSAPCETAPVEVYNTIRNCLVQTNVTNTDSGNNFIGGIIGHAKMAKNTIEGCVYAGTLSSKGCKGGMIGWSDWSKLTLTNSFFNGTNSGDGSFNPVGCKTQTYDPSDCWESDPEVILDISINNFYYNTDGNITNFTSALYKTQYASNWNKHARTVTLAANPTAGGTVSLGSSTDTYSVSGITAYSTGIKYNSTFYAGSGDVLSVTATANAGYSFSQWNGGSTSNPYSYTMPNSDASLTATFELNIPHTIASVEDWDAFCAAVNSGHSYSGETVTLMNDISGVTTMANHEKNFEGTFDGNNHTIEVNYTSTVKRCAPFPVVVNATFKDLTITGTISTSHTETGGFVGYVGGNNGCSFTNCVSDVDITSSCTGSISQGGFVGQMDRGSNPTATFTGCAFTGSFSGSERWGGFVGWNEGYASWSSNYSTVILTNCVFAPRSITNVDASDCATWARSTDSNNTSYVTITNCYYTQALGTAQGKQAYSITATSPVIVAMSGNPTVQYDESGINVYNSGITFTNNNTTTIYAGSGETVALTLSGANTYEADHGTLTGSGSSYSLTMAASNTVISGISCAVPTNLQCTYYTTNSATLAWTAGGDETQWHVQYGVQDSPNPQILSTTDNPYVLTLTEGYTYEIKVRAVCDNENDVCSDWSNTITVTPQALTYVFTNYGGNGDGKWNTLTNWQYSDPNIAVETLPTINDNVQLMANVTIPSGYTATANAIANTDSNSGNTYTITIADGGQLQHNNEHVMAVVEKEITGYTEANVNTNKGYHLISSPIDGGTNDFDNLVSTNANEYDLYSFDYRNGQGLLEWVDMTGTDGTQSLDNTVGYLYARQENATISTPIGEILPSNTDKPVYLQYDGNGTYRFDGWNLVGNPFVCDAYVSGFEGEYDDEEGYQPSKIAAQLSYYVLNHAADYDEFVVPQTLGAIAPMGAVMVQATAANQFAVFSRTAPTSKGGSLNLNIAGDATRGTIDRAVLAFGNTMPLGKFQLNPDHTKVYIPMDGNDYAVAKVEGAGAVPVNFKAEHSGRYTISVNAEEVSFNYLHLIDNMTGADIDLLATPSYSFESRTTDYESRFRLVFATGDNSASESFAFFSNGTYVINNDGDATLQVIDLTGRVLSSEAIHGSVSKAIQAAPGVYMLRLINGNDVKVQKVVVR